MHRTLRNTIKLTWLFTFLCFLPVKAQILQDEKVLNMVREDIDLIYNLQFDEAREVYNNIINSYPGHPIEFLLKGMMNYWENYPMLPTTPSRISFEEDMRQCIKLSEENTNTSLEAEFLLADLCARGFLLLFYSDNDLTMDVIPLAISTYKYIRQSFDYASSCIDLRYFTGMYNYYREKYPIIYPVYKSVAILFPHGDIEAGLKELKSSAASAIVLRAESSFLLSWIYLNYENSYPDALYYCQTLHNQYPENTCFSSLYIKNLLIMREYDEAEKLISAAFNEDEMDFFQSQLMIFKGILQEKKYSDLSVAQHYYSEGIRFISYFGEYGVEYSAYAYYGLSRISQANGDKKSARIYRKEADKRAEFKKINFDR